MQVKHFFIFAILLFPFDRAVAQNTAETEWIKTYFNMPSDTSVMFNETKSNSSWDLISTIEQLIDSSKHSVDLSIYDLEEMRIADALVRARKRGVRIRLVTDNNNRTDGGVLDET